MQHFKWKVLDQLGSIRRTPWAGLSSSSVKNATEVQFTNRLIQKRYNAESTSSCTGEKISSFLSPSYFLTRSGDEWLIQGKGSDRAAMKAKGGADPRPHSPPGTGWQFYDSKTETFKEDPSLTCNIPVTLPPCCLTVTMGGEAKAIQGKCEGKYQSTGLVSMGRQVIIL